MPHKRILLAVLIFVSLQIYGVPAKPTPLAQSAGPTSLSASQIDSVFSEFSRRTLERFQIFLLHSEDLVKQEALQKEGTAFVADAARYRQAVADHDAACKDRDWKLPAYGQCPGSKARLDEWKRTSSQQVADWTVRQKSNQEKVAALQLRMDEIDRRISDMNTSLGITPFASAKQCTQADASLHLMCLQEVWSKADGLIRLQLDNMAYRYAYPDTVPTLSPFARHTESLLVGGTGWVYGYYVPSPTMLKDEQERNLQRQLSLAGVSPEKFVNRADYDMIIGVAKSQDQFLDLVGRVVLGLGTNPLAGDQFSLGGYSAANRQIYASLKGTQTTRLDCHSNGAMVCLNALWNGDVGADTVRLFGPQITPAALARWEALLKGGKIKGLEINLMKGDPIAPASYGFGSSPAIYATIELARLVAARGSLVKLDAFAPEAGERLKSEIRSYAPAIAVNVIDDPSCRGRIASDNFACHDMALYQKRTSTKR